MAAARPHLEEAVRDSDIEIIDYIWYGGEASIETAEQLHRGDKLMVTGQTTGVYTAQVGEMRLGDAQEPVDVVRQGDVFSVKTSEVLHRGDKLYRVDRVEDLF